MEPIDRVSAVSQVIWTLAIFFILYMFMLFVVLPKIHKGLRIRNYLFDENVKKSFRLSYIIEIIALTFIKVRRKKLKEVLYKVENNNNLHDTFKHYKLVSSIFEFIFRVQGKNFVEYLFNNKRSK